MNTLSDTVLAAILQKLAPYRLPAIRYLDALQKRGLATPEKKKLIHMLTTAVHHVTSTKQKQQFTGSLHHLKRLYKHEASTRHQDKQDADLLLNTVTQNG